MGLWWQLYRKKTEIEEEFLRCFSNLREETLASVLSAWWQTSQPAPQKLSGETNGNISTIKTIAIELSYALIYNSQDPEDKPRNNRE